MRFFGLALLFMILTLSAGLFATEDFVDLVDKGNDAYQDEKYDAALELYNKAEVEQPQVPEIYYNQANTLIRKQQYDDAMEKIGQAVNTENTTLRADAFYNAGNAQFYKGDYQQAIEAYKKSLELRPEDMDAKYNLEIARIRLKEQMSEQPKDSGQQQQQENQDQEKQEEQQGQQMNQKEQEQQDQQSDESQNEQQQQAEQKQESPPQEEMSEEDAIRILNALNDTEEEMQKQVDRKVSGTAIYLGKDW